MATVDIEMASDVESAPESQYCMIIDANFIILLRTVDITAELLDHLVVRNVLTAEQTAEITDQLTPDARVSRMLRILHSIASRDGEAFLEKFLAVLREHGQEHVANVFRLESDKRVMTNEHHELLTCKLARLRKYIDPKWSGFLDILLRDNVFNVRDIQRVNIGRTYDEMAGEIVVILLRKSDDSVDKVVSALNETHQEHVSFILTGEGSSEPMTDEHIAALTQKTDLLRQFVDTDHGLLEKLLSVDVLNVAQHDFVRSRRTYDDRSVELIHILVRKSDAAFGHFLTALAATGQNHCVKIVTGEGDEDPLSVESMDRLTKLRSTLAGNTLLFDAGFVDMLISRSILAVSDNERIQQFESNIAKTGYILDLVARKSQRQFGAFIRSLRETGQQHVAMMLSGQEVISGVGGGSQTRGLAELFRAAAPSPRQELMRDLQRRVNNYINSYTAPPPPRKPTDTPLTGEAAVAEKMQEVFSHLEDKGIAISSVDKDTFGIKFRCYTPDALRYLRELVAKDELNRMLTEAYKPIYAEKGLMSVNINVSEEEFQLVEDTFKRNALMTDAHREALQSVGKFKADKVKITEALLDNLSLCKQRRQAVLVAEPGEKQVETLMDIVSRQADVEFQRLVDSLRADEQTEVADYLETKAAEVLAADPKKGNGWFSWD